MSVFNCRVLTVVFFTLISASSTRADILWGINGHPFVAYPGIGFEEQLDYLQDLGLTSYRVNIVNSGHAPDLARLVEAGKARGIDILPVVTPDFDLDSNAPDALYRKAFDLARTLVSQFKDDIRIWELGNEMENYAIIQPCEMRDDGVQYNCNWGPAGGVDVLDYYGPRWAKVAAVLNGLSDVVIAVDPDIRKAMGTAGWGHTGAFERMWQDGIKWDISVWHMYGADPERALKFLAGFDRPIWITEFNHPLGSQKSQQEQAAGLANWITRLRQLAEVYDIQAAHIYELMDEPYWAPSYEAFMGLVGVDPTAGGGWTAGAPKPAYESVRMQIRGQNAPPSRFLRPAPELFAGDAVTRSNCELTPAGSGKAAIKEQVAYSYCLILGREPDSAGREGWIASLSNGTEIKQMLLAMIQSGEFQKKFGSSDLKDENFVRLLYRLLLDREPDGHGGSAYLARMRKGELSRQDFALALIVSEEFRASHLILSGLVPVPAKP